MSQAFGKGGVTISRAPPAAASPHAPTYQNRQRDTFNVSYIPAWGQHPLSPSPAVAYDPKIPFYLTLPGLRRVPRMRKRKPSCCYATQRPDKNIDDLLEQFHGTFHQLRQSGIDEQLFDVISGFETLSLESAYRSPIIRQ